VSPAEQAAKLEAIDKVQAVIEFAMDGTILYANDNFLDAMGYTLDEIQGKHHRIFVDSETARSAEYSRFWQRLNEGQFQIAEYKRLGKGGRDVWIHASYNPLIDARGKPFKVVKYATDVTQQKLSNADYSGQIDAIGKSQAVIEFAMDGSILRERKLPERDGLRPRRDQGQTPPPVRRSRARAQLYLSTVLAAAERR
jgi:methyl-accepting chemotaxis protein